MNQPTSLPFKTHDIQVVRAALDQMPERRNTRYQAALASHNLAVGACAENAGIRWLDSLGLAPLTFPQDRASKHLYSPSAGKRPDAYAEIDGIPFLVDVKYHVTENQTFFALTDQELDKYDAFLGQFTRPCPPLLFALIPKESPTTIMLIARERLVVPCKLGGKAASGTSLAHDDIMGLIPRAWMDEERDRLVANGRHKPEQFIPPVY